MFRGEWRSPEMRGLDVEHFNQLVYDQWLSHSPEDVVAWHREVHADVVRTPPE